jgi:hypothetical protein
LTVPGGHALLCEKRGGAILGGGRLCVFRREVWLPYFSASWPLAVLQCYEDCITVKIGPVRARILTADVEEVRFGQGGLWGVLLTALLGSTVSIRHHGEAPKPMIFGSYGGLGGLATTFERLGVAVADR